jgi:nitrate/nitrite transport system permease protein
MQHLIQKYKLDSIFLPFVAILVTCLFWYVIAGKSVVTEKVDDFGDKIKVTKRAGLSADLPTPVETWTASKPYIVEPFAKRGEMDQGILRFTWYVPRARRAGLRASPSSSAHRSASSSASPSSFTKTFDPIIQVLRPVSPLAWLPLGLDAF